MSALQDVSFDPADDLEMTKRKLRIMQEEVLRLSQALSQYVAVNSDGQVEFGTPASSASAGSTPLTYIHITVNGVEGRVAILPP